jgi:hypothetical protein
MKNTVFGMLILMIATSFIACGPTTEQAVEYNDALVEQQRVAIEKIDAVYESFANYTDQNGMDRALTAAQQQAAMSLDNVKKMDGFDGSTEFRDAAVALLETYKAITINEFPQLVALYKLPEGEYTQEKKDEADKLLSESSVKTDQGMAGFQAAQEVFGKKYKLTFEEEGQ